MHRMHGLVIGCDRLGLLLLLGACMRGARMIGSGSDWSGSAAGIAQNSGRPDTQPPAPSAASAAPERGQAGGSEGRAQARPCKARHDPLERRKGKGSFSFFFSLLKKRKSQNGRGRGSPRIDHRTRGAGDVGPNFNAGERHPPPPGQTHAPRSENSAANRGRVSGMNDSMYRRTMEFLRIRRVRRLFLNRNVDITD